RSPPAVAKWRRCTDRKARHGSRASMTKFTLNGRTVSAQRPAAAPLPWVIRDELGLTGTKCGCGIGFCGACTVHVEGRATRSCVTPLAAVAGANVTTIEGLHPEGKHPLQEAWRELQ